MTTTAMAVLECTAMPHRQPDFAAIIVGLEIFRPDANRNCPTRRLQPGDDLAPGVRRASAILLDRVEPRRIAARGGDACAGGHAEAGAKGARRRDAVRRREVHLNAALGTVSLHAPRQAHLRRAGPQRA